METTFYCAVVPDEAATVPTVRAEWPPQVDPQELLHALSAAQCEAAGLTRSYRFHGAQSLTRADQRCWLLVIAIRELFRLTTGRPVEQIDQAAVREYSRLVAAVERGHLGRPSWYSGYMRKVEAWAEAYHSERRALSIRERAALYDDCLLDALASEDELP